MSQHMARARTKEQRRERESESRQGAAGPPGGGYHQKRSLPRPWLTRKGPGSSLAGAVSSVVQIVPNGVGFLFFWVPISCVPLSRFRCVGRVVAMSIPCLLGFCGRRICAAQWAGHRPPMDETAAASGRAAPHRSPNHQEAQSKQQITPLEVTAATAAA